jgi:hypothetical protein
MWGLILTNPVAVIIVAAAAICVGAAYLVYKVVTD